MFQITSNDDPTFGFRLIRLRTPEGHFLRYMKLEGGKFVLHREHKFSCERTAIDTYNSQRILLKGCAKLRGDNYVIQENENITPHQLTLEIAA